LPMGKFTEYLTDEVHSFSRAAPTEQRCISVWAVEHLHTRFDHKVVRIGNIAGRTRHAGPAAPASLVATPRTVIVPLANPICVLTAGAFHAGVHVRTSRPS
jgi:hypothetical protein